ncbi:MAG TPA: prepilin-type N-terminal cleavage/methylation domain-containing protein [Solirubrobacteraceae bacterium]|nr:prepilin-type N-terminal cleavage/methylation domain-containing protein [Solirubrobacteraceae bacterium]
MSRLRSQQGFTLVEVIIATFVLVVGVLSVVAGYSASRKLTLVAERRATMSHLAQREVERLQALTFSELAMKASPTHSTETTNPDYYFDGSGYKCSEEKGEGCLDWTREAGKEEERMAVNATSGVVEGTPSKSCEETPVGSCNWVNGKLKGSVYDFVTWHVDKVCKEKEKLCSSETYKRITVAVTLTVSSGTHTVTPVWISQAVPNPKAVPEGTSTNGNANPVENPEIKCGTPVKECLIGIDKGKTQTWELHDSAAAETLKAPTANHAVHATVAPAEATCTSSKTTAACPTPDLMDANAPTATTLYNYSTDLGTTPTEYEGGRLLKPDAECSGTPTSTENAKGELWVTAPLAAEAKLTGVGGLSLYTQTLRKETQTVTLCVAVYNVPEKIENLVKETPTKLGYGSYTPTSWPTSMTQISFVFEYGKATIPAKNRIGLRVWEAKSSTGNIAIAYDVAAGTTTVEEKTVETEGDNSYVQLNTE